MISRIAQFAETVAILGIAVVAAATALLFILAASLLLLVFAYAIFTGDFCV